MCVATKVFYTEEELFQIRMNKTHKERYSALMDLIRTDRMLKRATIAYPYKTKPLIK